MYVALTVLLLRRLLRLELRGLLLRCLRARWLLRGRDLQRLLLGSELQLGLCCNSRRVTNTSSRWCTTLGDQHGLQVSASG
jgi:hypothetical protein